MVERPGRVCCYTSLTFSYLARGRILAETLRAAHPDWDLWVVLVDEPPSGLDLSPLREFDRVVNAADLAIPRFKSWMFKHNVVEACTSVKGQALVELLAAGYETVVYLDPDIAVFHPLTAVLEPLGDHSVILTPHQCEPNEAPIVIADSEGTSLRYGVYNLGFVAVRNDATGVAFARWWAAQLLRACYDEPEIGLFTDQKYCDLVPGLFPRVRIERDPGCNVASWNLSRRRITFEGGDIRVNGSLLKFYHFTKIGGAGDVMTQRHGAGSHEVAEVWAWYKRALVEKRVSGSVPGWWHYGRFSDGAPITDAVRRFYRQRGDLMAYFDDPFAVEGNSLRAWLAREAPHVLPAERDVA